MGRTCELTGFPGRVGDLDALTMREARSIVSDLLSECRSVVVADAVLVADELISNAHRHGGAPRLCRIKVLEGRQRLRIEVDDSSVRLPRARTPDASGGRGITIIEQLATAWGVERHSRHKTVWAEVSLARR